jgi:hypothetical protein
MAKLARAVHVTDPHSGRRLVLQPGEEPAEHLAALITTPSAWEDGQAPGAKEADNDDATGDTSGDSDDDGDRKAAPAAKKTAARKSAATKPARGREAADQGDSGA